MSKRSLISIHARGLVFAAVAVTMEILALSHARADAEYFAPTSPPDASRGYTVERRSPAQRSCEILDFFRGDESCGSTTSGPAGGFF